ncbi:unnamed protein product [Prunus armeniaca]|uniref:Uncharacterized protein n=1 Tax=Prunus armeniaca TaxID=36596 RepID=A0A6J5WCL3_PRUAR|nr:unnamed protein product [Prunus armeniaca]CAB4296068.1 unnamed protein product [Prunus armeniaca]
MITRSNLAEQLREYQIRSKHDWASVSFFSSTSNHTLSREGSFPNCCLHSLNEVPTNRKRAFATCFSLTMHSNAFAFVHKNYQASEIGEEKETKDASSLIYVILDDTYYPTLWCKS